MKNEKISENPVSGYIMLVVALIISTAGIYMLVLENPFVFAVFLLLAFVLRGFYFINPNTSRVMVLFGEYRGTVKKNGFFWTNPFYLRQTVSLRARNFYSERVKVNDKLGNPILISVILVWQVKDTYKASFDVDVYEDFVKVQCDAAVRKLAGSYPYDNFDDDQTEITLRSGLDDVNEALEVELSKRLAMQVFM